MLHDVPTTAKWLRRFFPVKDCKVRVRLVSKRYLKSSDALCVWCGKSFAICLNREDSVKFQIECLLHEWAHALTLPRHRVRKKFHTHAWRRTLGEIHAARERYLGNH
jgi:hypothetical protein